MSIEPHLGPQTAPARRARRHRADLAGPGRMPGYLAASAVAWLALGFVVVGGGGLELGRTEARLGLAIDTGIGPFGQVFGGWEPSVWPLPLALGRAWAVGFGDEPANGPVRWPAALAGVAIGWLLARRVATAIGPRASVIAALCWYGSLALMDRSAGLGLDLVAGLGTIAALDRLVAGRADGKAGAWAALAFLGGGWPPLAVIGLAAVVIGRRASTPGLWFALPVVGAAAVWSAWAWSVAPAGAWAAALMLPMTQKSAWWLAPGVILQGLPWTPFAALGLWPAVRRGWTAEGRTFAVSWLQVAGAAIVAGTIVPGLSTAARPVALAGLALAAASAIDLAWSGADAWPRSARRALAGVALATVAAWVVVSTVGATYLALAVSYYRPLAIAVVCLAAATVAVAAAGIWTGSRRRLLEAVALVAIGLKVAHAGYYVPEWNYRFSQGPWGRAIGQWVPPRRTIYTVHAWEADLAHATRHPVRQLANPKLLDYQRDPEPRFVLLHPAEFAHWPADAKPLVRIQTMQDEFGAPRILARTAGPYSWRRSAAEGREAD